MSLSDTYRLITKDKEGARVVRTFPARYHRKSGKLVLDPEDQKFLNKKLKEILIDNKEDYLCSSYVTTKRKQ